MRGIIIFIIGVSAISAAFPDVIYDEQTYNYDEMYIPPLVGPEGYKVADDFETDGDWLLELIKVWLVAPAPGDVLVELFADSGAGPDDGNVLFSEIVGEADSNWSETGDPYEPPIYEVDLPVNDFDIAPGTRYWLSLNYLDDYAGWPVMLDSIYWWDTVYLNYYGSWEGWWGPFGEHYGCMFELHGTPDDSGVNARSLGGIKALYR
jgi:hypothetical protein